MSGEQASSPAGPRTDTGNTAGTASNTGYGETRATPVAAGGPDFRFAGSVHASESYVSNARGLANARRSDFVSTLSLGVDLSEHSPRLNLDARYAVSADYYADGTVPTQISNHLLALGDVAVIPDYFNISARAFAQPVVISELGIVTADNRVVPDGFRNTYGYSVNPLFKFRLGDFATSNTMPSFGQIFFTNPRGTTGVASAPGVTGPRDSTIRSLTEQISSGAYFSRLNWSLIGAVSEAARSQTMLSEKAGLADLRYAVSYTFSLLATGGYDKISNTTPLTKDLSGPVAMGGFGLDFGPDFAFRIEAGTKYNSFSLQGNLRYNITPTSTLVARADDYIQTPAGQLLNNLSNLTALNDGNLVSKDDVLGNGFGSSLSSFDVQSPGGMSLDNRISRYQVVNASFLKDFQRNHVDLSAFATRRTILEAPVSGRSRTQSVGARLMLSRDISPLLVGRVGGTISRSEEFGGQGDTVRAEGQLDYTLSREMRAYLRSSYLERFSSNSLQGLSPVTGNTNDFRVILGVSRTF